MTATRKATLDGTAINALCQSVRDRYLADARPWVIGFSGGKDSTAVLQVVWQALSTLPKESRSKPVFVISSDTLVETPVIVNSLNNTLGKINEVGRAEGLPFEAHKVTPAVDDTFWVNIIGRGYPAPYNKFRWCTDRMKIRPASRFILERIAAFGEVILVLGARKSESASRAQVMTARKQDHQGLSRHPELVGAWVYTPIEDWHTDDVWTYLLNTASPWGNNNRDLVTMYQNAQSGECPLVVDKSTPSCGNSRFGCWTCTVVDRDKSMEAMIDKGQQWMEPLLDFRDWLAATQDPETKKRHRDFRRRTGQIQFWQKDGGPKKLIWGPYKLSFRKEMLKRLLETQKSVRTHGPNPNEQLITTLELHKIRQLWRFEEGDWEDSLPKIYENVFGQDLEWVQDDAAGLGKPEEETLQEVCASRGIPPELVVELFDAERKQHGMSRRSAIYDDIEKILKKDWRNLEQFMKEEGVVDAVETEEAE